MTCPEDDGLTDGQLTRLLLVDFLLQPGLDIRSEEVPIGEIDAAIHVAKAVSWTDDSIGV